MAGAVGEICQLELTSYLHVLVKLCLPFFLFLITWRLVMDIHVHNIMNTSKHKYRFLR